MNAPITLVQLDRGVKRCRDCVHCIQGDNTVMDYCGRTVRLIPATAQEGHWLTTIERESNRDGACGERAIHFAPTDDYQAKRSVRKLQQVRAIEDAIMHLHPDATDAQSILDALTQSLKDRYEHKAQDALECAKEFREALDDVEELEVAP